MEHGKKLHDWMHSFSVGETRNHNGYTIYKITSIVFPRYLPEALSSVTLWKRFSDVKKLYKDLARKHRERHLTGTVPKLTDKTFFKRFDAKIIEERKNYILKLLEFASKEPILYQSHAFVKFFERGISPEGSPVKGGNIAAICEDLAIPIPREIALVDPTRDEGDGGVVEECCDGVDVSTTGSVRTGNGSMIDSVLSQSSALSVLESQELDGNGIDVVDQMNITMDYIVEAAILFSTAVQAEASGNFKTAFEEYKAGIDILLSGAKTDTNPVRKKMAKEKTSKYVLRAEEIYEKYLLHQEDGDVLQFSPIALPSSPIQLLERPLNYLSRYKVVQVVDGRLMQVQDCTDKKFYIMKGIRKPPGVSSQGLFFPCDIPYMVPLVAYFQSDSSVFLLLKLVCGGKLWDYICSYRKTDKMIDIEGSVGEQEDFASEICPTLESSNESDCSQTAVYDSGFVDLVNECSSKAERMLQGQPSDEIEEAQEADYIDEVDCIDSVLEEETFSDYIPSFEVLSKDMDASDLVNCSQQLLKAVNQTLEQSQQQPDPIERQCTEKSREVAQTEEPKRLQIDSSQFKTYVNENIAGADPLPEGCIKRWISELIIAVDTLHSNGIICGDLTMDNLLLGSDGQLMLTYFYRKENFLSVSFPTMELRQGAVQRLYVAPERPLEPKSDFWSVGVLLFEMLTRKSFVSCHPAGVFCYHEVQYPEDAQVSDEAKELLDGLLQPLPENRIDFKWIIARPFFHTIDWSDVKQRGQT
ncbi:ribosomal protein S6 kinase delta-1 [Toxorhynchites rutilus septentrionalis]|uniref:ribosomal protein S6 kinase delta-1 n=1 Tax=Toxorhynchites rutilus septentrionalis TaxID=329112 RepID=UPI0024785D27|nr:ribosomal protein S6 kinase delta-1 [Toxorhynchites rutilus septentrionalis]